MRREKVRSVASESFSGAVGPGEAAARRGPAEATVEDHERRLAAPEVVGADRHAPEERDLDGRHEVAEGRPQLGRERGPGEDLAAGEGRLEGEARERVQVAERALEKHVHRLFVTALGGERTRALERDREPFEREVGEAERVGLGEGDRGLLASAALREVHALTRDDGQEGEAKADAEHPQERLGHTRRARR